MASRGSMLLRGMLQMVWGMMLFFLQECKFFTYVRILISFGGIPKWGQPALYNDGESIRTEGKDKNNRAWGRASKGYTTNQYFPQKPFPSKGKIQRERLNGLTVGEIECQRRNRRDSNLSQDQDICLFSSWLPENCQLQPIQSFYKYSFIHLMTN